MTTEKMPDVINITVSKNAVGVKDYQVSKLKPNTRYLRAEPVEELLEKIRDQVEFCKKHDHTPALDKTMNLIDKFLGAK